MVDTKELIYKKAHTELNEVFKRLSDIELSKIPSQLIEYVRANMDTDYIWEYDDSKKLEEQDFLVETKALIVEIYGRYLCPEDKKEFWKKYNQVCLNMIEEKKKEEYDPDDIFKKKEKIMVKNHIKQEENMQMIEYKESIFRKIINKILKIFNKR